VDRKFWGFYHYAKNGFHDYNNLRLLSNYSHVLNRYHFFKVQPLLRLHDYKYDYKLQLHN